MQMAIIAMVYFMLRSRHRRKRKMMMMKRRRAKAKFLTSVHRKDLET